MCVPGCVPRSGEDSYSADCDEDHECANNICVRKTCSAEHWGGPENIAIGDTLTIKCPKVGSNRKG